MSAVYYFDTSAVVKLYHQELGTRASRSAFRRVNSTIMISELTVVELNSTVARKLRTGEIDLERIRAILKKLR